MTKRAVVYPSLLQRWQEQLCRLNHQRLEEILVVRGTNYRLKPKAVPDKGGVYAFWWTGSLKRLKAANRNISLVGPGGRLITVRMDDEWLGFSAKAPVPLYVGKSAAGISRRIKGHFYLQKPRALPKGPRVKKAKAPTTSCQLRAGIDHLFPKVADTREVLMHEVGFSYVVLPGDENAANRFYLEDLAIGTMRPPLNVDVER